MPNHVFHIISVEQKYADKLKQISKKGICRYFLPRPEALESTTSPAHIVSQKEYDKQMEENKKTKDKYVRHPLTQKMSDELKRKYGFDDWYSWSVDNWGTKWGAYDNEFEKETNTYRFTTAWSPPSPNIIEALTEVIPDFTWEWEEEQGFGELWHSEKGYLHLQSKWDTPKWDWDEENLPEEYQGVITYLPQDYTRYEETYKKGYYSEYCLNEWLGDSLEEAVKSLKD